MYAVGTFTQMSGNNGTATQTFSRSNVFSFSESAPFTVTSWSPDVNGTVNTIAFNGNCATAYIGGQFTTVGGIAAKNIAAINTNTGALVSGFKDNAGGQVETILAVNGHLLTGGFFKGIGGSATEGIARQPDATARIQTAMIIAAALVEGVALFVAVIAFLIQGKITF